MEQQSIRERLTELQWRVTQEGQTESAFSHPYSQETASGDYFCIVCGVLLYDSNSKFQSDCGWPAFSKGIQENIKEITEPVRGRMRTEIRCNNCNSHLGHTFKDGRSDTRIRHCVNGSSLNFVKKA